MHFHILVGPKAASRWHESVANWLGGNRLATQASADAQSLGDVSGSHPWTVRDHLAGSPNGS